MDTMKAAILSTSEKKEKYDATLKQQMADRQILARVLKRFVPEFEGCEIRDIEKKYILADTITVSKIGVQKNMTNLVESTGTEDKSNNEGNITYDIMFRAGYPGKKNETIGLYINLEIQNKYYPGYPLETRAVYYAARRLSSELPKIDDDTNYGELQKVYSIWLCMGDDVPDKKAGTASLYHMVKDDILGKVEVPEEYYDLISVIMLRVNDEAEINDETLHLLQTLCSRKVGKQEKLEELRKAGILTESLEGGIGEMCNLSESIYQEGSKKTNILTVCRMLTDHMPIQIIAKYANMGEDEVEKIQGIWNEDASDEKAEINRIYLELCMEKEFNYV